MSKDRIKGQLAPRLAVLFFFLISQARAEDSTPKTQVIITPGANGSIGTATPQIILPTNNQPTPATTTPNTPVSPGTPGAPIPVQVPNAVNYGRFRNKDGTAKVGAMMLDRYKESVVRIAVRDHAGNILNQAMGVAVGKEQTYIAVPLSLLLGNSIQWADQIDIQHYAGNHYSASVALIDEQMDLALLNPENMPPPIPFVREDDERSGVNIFTIGFSEAPAENGKDIPSNALEPKIFKGSLAAANPSAGSLSVSKEVTENSNAGTGIINMQGELVGMLLPNGRGVLSSHISADIEQAKRGSPLPIRMLGTITGRGVLVDPSLPEAFKTISAALAAIKKGDAPRANQKLFIPAKTREFAPREANRVILKVMPGIYKEVASITLPEKISFTGSGPKETILMVTSPNIPVLKIENAKGISVTGFRIVPAPLQPSESSTVLVNRSDGVVLLGNIIEAKGGSAVQILRSLNIGIFGNSFPKGNARAILCKESDTQAEANSFLGDWPQAVTADKGCTLKLSRNLFLETQLAVALSGFAKRASITKNTFMRSVAGIRFFGEPLASTIQDNIFSGGVYSFYSTADFNPKKIGRNHAWKNVAIAKNKQINTLDMVRVEPVFENPDTYDYRPKLRNAVAGSGADSTELGRSDLGAYQRTDYLGKYTSYFIRTLEAATGSNDLATEWGFEK